MADHWAQAPVRMACRVHALGDDALVDWLVEQHMDEGICAFTCSRGPTRARAERLGGDWPAWALLCAGAANERLRLAW